MDRMLVVVFNDEAKAYQGKTALMQLQDQGNVNVYGYAVVAENADRSATIKQSDNSGPLGSLFGMSFGALAGALFGPVGMLLGAAGGLGGGAAVDFTNLGVGQDFLDDIAKTLTPGKVALVAEVDEEWTAPVDSSMEVLGGVVLRRALSDVQKQVREENIAAMKADVAQYRAEMAQAHADRKAKLQEKIGQLESRIQAQVQKLQERSVISQKKAQAKATAAEAKAAVARAKAS
ncbi:MAG TPA: DUF1269 domain-containing protein [Acidobacteriaceae bacterium]|nr:DUF1269 domain-containing protein [Acidobacteriaceae bacterium]